MLVELAIGDSYGGAFEYAKPEFVTANNNGTEYRQHPKHRGIKPGSYTDDTQMSLAVAELILEDAPWDKLTIARRFVDVFKRDERTGYAGHFYKFLKSVKTGDELLAQIKPESEKSGGAMRAPVIGIYPRIDIVMERAVIQASVTHNTPAGVSAAMAAALMTHYFLYNLGPKKDLGKFIADYVTRFCPEIKWAEPYREPVGSKGWMSVRAAMTAVMASKSETEILVRSVAYTGDVDTVAAIAMAAGTLSDEIELNMDQKLIDGLESGTYGFGYLYDLDAKLARRATSFRKAPATAPDLQGWTLPPSPPVAHEAGTVEMPKQEA